MDQTVGKAVNQTVGRAVNQTKFCQGLAANWPANTPVKSIKQNKKKIYIYFLQLQGYCALIKLSTYRFNSDFHRQNQ